MTTEFAVPDVQKAWVVVAQGKPERALRFKSDWPVTKRLDPGHVLVKIQAAALNPVGYKMMKLAPNFVANRPHVAEYDFAGVIVDENDSNFKKGDEVFGWANTAYQRISKQGALAEYVVVPASEIALKPANITPIQASGITLTAITALHSLDQAGLEEGQTILINGASTAVGSFAIQLAKIKGAKVVAVASGRNEQYVRNLGADEFIDYTKVGPLHKYLEKSPPSPKYNVVLEAVGIYDPSLYTSSKSYLAPNGVYLSVGPQPKLGWKTVWDTLRLFTVFLPSFLTGYRTKFAIPVVKNEENRLERLRAWLEEGKLKPVVDTVYNFEDTLKAYERIMSSRATGKVVVKVDNSLES
ncbi:quinone oxidoreductase [Coprinopsis cinerea okayama7|uniref:Quinone oxidoreductase n=1 Tax=Coprinopsis cinerea (strain Okayama-7 / 130 / ATCC MYA-4618 / FGSC 9003) TaxID=240176 RepID=D6RKR3_COPC7|nr:quinone oxidoreductase [Coprinopsis cinerea okayama7\|eukprot:XP_002911935.1 quinone oxidoreductase [Coprinopsis cinerea okayama7\